MLPEPVGVSDPENDIEKPYGPTAVLTPANIITFLRVAATPPLIYLILRDTTPTLWWALIAWIVLMLSDLVDGALARRQGITTSGAYLDPLADKFAVLGALTALAWIDRFAWLAVGIIALRELAVSLFRSYASRNEVSVPATPFGKAKTLTQSIAIGVALLPLVEPHSWMAQVSMWTAVGFTVASGLDYLRRGRDYLTKTTPSPPPDEGRIEESLMRQGRVSNDSVGNIHRINVNSAHPEADRRPAPTSASDRHEST